MTPERFARLRAVLSRRQPDLTVLMDGVHKPHNLSAVARTGDAVGVLEVHTVPASRLYRLDRQVAAGTEKWIPAHAHDTIGEAVTHLRTSGFTLVAAHPDPAAVDFRALDYTRATAFVMGAERDGLSDETLALVDRTVIIPMVGMVRSLNVSVAGALLLYEAQRQRAAAGLYGAPRLAPEAFARRLFEWAYPDLARRCREAGVPYPDLDDEGTLVQRPDIPGLIDDGTTSG